jgi:hypothetical protein
MHPIIRNALIGGGSGGGGGPFYPTSLFSSGEKGLFYDFSDMASLFQDVAGTTPITESGQTSARINDLSGNGNYATQPTTAWRPQFVQAGGLNYLFLCGLRSNHPKHRSIERTNNNAVALGFIRNIE